MGQKADQLPGYRLIENAEHREAVARVWGVDAGDAAAQGQERVRAARLAWPRGRHPRAAGVRLERRRRLAARRQHRAPSWRSLDLLVVCDAFENETAQTAHVILPVEQWAEEEGTMTNLEGRVILRRRGARAAARREAPTSTSSARWPSGWATATAFRFARPRGGVRGVAPGDRGRARPITAASPTSGSAASRACSGRAPRRTTPERRGCSPSGSPPRRQGALLTRAPPARGGGARRGVSLLLHDRALQGALQLGRADAPGGGAGRRQARAARADASAAGGAAGRGRRAGRAASRAGAAGRVRGRRHARHPARHAVRAVPLGRPRGREPAHQPGAGSRPAACPSSRCAPCARQRGRPHRAAEERRDRAQEAPGDHRQRHGDLPARSTS